MNKDFKKELEHLINKHSLENDSDTPDFILAEYLNDCLIAFNKAVNRREEWYGRERKSGSGKLTPTDIPLQDGNMI